MQKIDNNRDNITPFLAKKQFMINHFFVPKTHTKPPVSNTPFVGYHLAYNKHLPGVTGANAAIASEGSTRPTSLSLPSTTANPFACFMNVPVGSGGGYGSANKPDTELGDASNSGSGADVYMMAFDGCSKGNPGRAGAGAVIYRNQVEIWADSKFVGVRETNNVAEYAGLIMGLHEALRQNITRLTVQGDSELIIKQMKKEYAVKSANIKAYYEMAESLAKKFAYVHFKHVYRDHNVRADALSNEGLVLKMDAVDKAGDKQGDKAGDKPGDR